MAKKNAPKKSDALSKTKKAHVARRRAKRTHHDTLNSRTSHWKRR